ncbi:MAG: response regulator [Cyclobacteriaceae bacterium]|nr:response regulator [Cyclobacteriaceae bacterium]
MKILVVDDEQDVKILFEQRFRKEIRDKTLELVFAFSGEEALEYFQSANHEFVLILSDINMPGMSGLDLLGKIREAAPQAPPVIMMITAYGDEENRQTAEKLGANDFLTKPVNFTDLKERIKQEM